MTPELLVILAFALLALICFALIWVLESTIRAPKRIRNLLKQSEWVVKDGTWNFCWKCGGVKPIHEKDCELKQEIG